MSQILCQVTEYMVNLMQSLFTATTAFEMDDETMYSNYGKQNANGEGLVDESMSNVGIGCWKWLTDREAMKAENREKARMDLLAKGVADDINRQLELALKGKKNLFMVPSSGWEQAYDAYIIGVKNLVKKNFSTTLPEGAAERKIYQGMMRKLEWVTMKHQGHHEPCYPLLTKGVLPLMGDLLKRVENAISEVI